jgi:hypothetical protein
MTEIDILKLYDPAVASGAKNGRTLLRGSIVGLGAPYW